MLADPSWSIFEPRQVFSAATTPNAAPRPAAAAFTRAPLQDNSSDAAATGTPSRSFGSADIGTSSGSGSGAGVGVGDVVTDGKIASDAAPISAVDGSGRTHPAGSAADLSSRKRDRAEGSADESAPEPHIYVPPSSKKRR